MPYSHRWSACREIEEDAGNQQHRHATKRVKTALYLKKTIVFDIKIILIEICFFIFILRYIADAGGT